MGSDHSDGGRTRREAIRLGGALLGAGFIAGCTGGGGGDGGDTGGEDPTVTETPRDDPTQTETPTDTETTTPTETETTTDGPETPYTVSMAPVGEVEFGSVPETWVANNGSWADMGVALGLEPPEAVWLSGRYHTQYYEAVDGVSVDGSKVDSLYSDGVSKEVFYELDADVHVMDPNFLMNRFKGWKRADVEEIAESVGPMFGNCIYAQHYPWHDDYRYYSLYEGFEKLAQVFKRTDRYEAFEAVHDEFRENLAPHVPGPSDRPEVAVLWGVGNEPEKFYPYVIGEGTGFKHLNDLGVRDALASTDIKDFHGSRAAIDLETVLKVDPEVLMLRGYEGMTHSEFEDTVVRFLESDGTAGALSAVRNGEVYRAGGLYQGPITNMVLTERTASNLYGVDQELFDRDRVAAVVEGDF